MLREEDLKYVYDCMVDKTAEYLRNNGLKTMVLGISGGIDSTLCAAICREIADKYPEEDFKLIGVSLPCSTNSKEENDSANLTMEAFCNESWTENLQKEYMLMKTTCEQYCESTNISQGNIKARLRMIYLYNIASVRRGLVMGTANMSEDELGFSTLWGDDASDFAPFAKLWKSEVFQLVKWLYEYKYTTWGDEKKRDALMAAYNMTPTDGNGVKSGGDMAQIAPGYTYNEVDLVLQWIVDELGEQNPSDELIQEFIDRIKCEWCYNLTEEMVKGVIKRHFASAFKRKHLPVRIPRECFVNPSETKQY